MVTRPLGLVTLTPRALALAMMSTRLREETAWAILLDIAVSKCSIGVVKLEAFFWQDRASNRRVGKNILSSVGAVVHKEELDVLGVVDEESLVA